MSNYLKLIQSRAENKHPKTICCDFDGTISVANKFPEISAPNYLFIEKLKQFKRQGYKIIISSCRWSTAIQSEKEAAEKKKEVEKWLKENEVPYDDLWADNKVFADIYFDDKSFNVHYLDEFDEQIDLLKKAEKNQKYEYCCLMLNMPKEVSAKVKSWREKNIKKEWVVEGNSDPDTIHLSVIYGLVEQRIRVIKEFLEKHKDLIPAKIKMGEVSKFEHEDKDIIKIEVISDDVKKLHDAIVKNFVNYSDFPDFKMHITITFCKPHAADKLLGIKIFGDKEFLLDEFEWSIASTGEQKSFKITDAKDKE